MAIIDDINRILRDFESWDAQNPLPVGDPRSGVHDIRKFELRQVLIAILQTLGDPSALQQILSDLGGKAALQNSTASFSTRQQAVERGQANLPTSLGLILTRENGRVVFRSPPAADDDPLFETQPRWGVVVRAPNEADLLAEAAVRASGNGENRALAETALAKEPFRQVFDTGEGGGISAAITSPDGAILTAWDDRFRQLALKEFRFFDGSSADDIAVAQVLDDGRVLFGIDYAGRMIGAGGGAAASGQPVAGYVSGGNIRAVNGADTVAAPLGPFGALSVSPAEAAPRAVITQPMIGPARTVRAGRGLLVPDSDKVLHVIIGLGQSLMVGAQASGTLVSVQSLFPEALMFTRSDGLSDVRMGLVTQDGVGAPVLDGAQLVGFEPLVARVGQGSGGRGETPMEALANALAREARLLGAQFRTLSFTAAMGGTAYSGLQKGTQTYANMLAALNRAVALAAVQGWQVVVDACLVKHGEANQSDSGYLGRLLSWQANVDADVKAITGQSAAVHFILSQPSSHGTTTPFAVQAMLDAHNSSPVHHLCGPDYPFSDVFSSDFLHMTGPGYFWIGDQFARAYKQALWSGAQKSKIVQIVSGSRAGAIITLNYEVPVPPLVIDTDTVTPRGMAGFRVFVRGSQMQIADVSVTGPAQVTITLDSAPSGADCTIDYAMAGQSSPRTAANIPRGNLRDSAADISAHLERPIRNWAVHQTFSM